MVSDFIARDVAKMQPRPGAVLARRQKDSGPRRSCGERRMCQLRWELWSTTGAALPAHDYPALEDLHHKDVSDCSSCRRAHGAVTGHEPGEKL